MSKDDLTYVETEGGPFILLPLEPKPLIVGEAEVTAFRPTKDGGVFVQRVFGDEDEDVIAAVDEAIASGKWKTTKHVLPIGEKGKLALFDSAYAYEDADEDEVLKITLAPGSYAIETARVKTKDVEAGLVRLRRK